MDRWRITNRLLPASREDMQIDMQIGVRCVWQQASKQNREPLCHYATIHRPLGCHPSDIECGHPSNHPSNELVQSIQQASSRGVEVPSQRRVCVSACRRVYAVTLLLSTLSMLVGWITDELLPLLSTIHLITVHHSHTCSLSLSLSHSDSPQSLSHSHDVALDSRHHRGGALGGIRCTETWSLVLAYQDPLRAVPLRVCNA